MRFSWTNVLILLGRLVRKGAVLYWRIRKPKTFGSRVVLRCDEEIMLVRHTGGQLWLFPGGGRKKNETPEECAIREIKEELEISIPLSSLKLFGIYTNAIEGKQDTIHLFTAEILKQESKLQWEIAEAAWFPIKNLPQNTSNATRNRISEILDGKPSESGLWADGTTKNPTY